MLTKTDACNSLIAEEDTEVAILVERTYGYGLSLERLSDTEALIAEVDPAGSLDFADGVADVILNRRQRVWKR